MRRIRKPLGLKLPRIRDDRFRCGRRIVGPRVVVARRERQWSAHTRLVRCHCAQALRHWASPAEALVQPAFLLRNPSRCTRRTLTTYRGMNLLQTSHKKKCSRLGCTLPRMDLEFMASSLLLYPEDEPTGDTEAKRPPRPLPPQVRCTNSGQSHQCDRTR